MIWVTAIEKAIPIIYFYKKVYYLFWQIDVSQIVYLDLPHHSFVIYAW